ncbi:MAG TPA: cyclic nucleotide-binding domain-containing protein [Polyangiaceae bacterium]|nr:cyclic nucleotide-binding domain-containing protein [Polyangiaceae bacterium]
MPPSPDSVAPSANESPLDRALTLLLAGEHEASLRWAAALLDNPAVAAAAGFVVARSLAELGRAEAAHSALELCIHDAIRAGNLPMAVAACCELRSQGQSPDARLDEIAEDFSKDSERLQKGARPPSLPGPKNSFEPLASDLGGGALLDEVESVLARETKRADTERESGAGLSKVSPYSLFSALGVSGLRAMIDVFDMQIVPEGAVIIEEGTIGAEAYVVARGQVEVQRARADAEEGESSAIRLARLGSGALFGEMALLSRSPRAASVIACRPSIILVATKDALDAVVAREPEVGSEFADHCRRRMLENLVRTSSILSAVDPGERPSLVDAFVTRTFEQGEKVIEQDQESDGLYLVASGEVAVLHKDGEESTMIARLGPGEVVGEVALVLRRPATADVIAEHPTVALHLPRDRFHDLIKKHPAVLSELYELAVKREEETSSIVAQEATDIDEFVLV